MNAVKLDSISVEQIFTQCTELIELSIGATTLDPRSINFLCENLTSKIEKLDLFDQNNFGEEHLEKLLNRCNKLTEFGILGTDITDYDPIFEKLSETLVKFEADQYDINDYFELRIMPNMKFICGAFGSVSKRDEQNIKRCFPHLKVLDETVNVASPYPYGYESLMADKNEYPSGFWDIKAQMTFL